jgi:hypothetical protein
LSQEQLNLIYFSQDGIICLSSCVAETPHQSWIEETPDILGKDSLYPLHNRLIYGFQPIKIWTGSLHFWARARSHPIASRVAKVSDGKTAGGI